MSVWSSVLDSCPGLLCCVINLKGRLIYATHGYKAIAARLFGHKCEEGRNYPPLISDVDRDIHDALAAACLGESNAIEIAENANVWELTASPLILPEDGEHKISGVVIRIVAASAKPQPPAPVVVSNPDILEAVAFRACVVDDKGVGAFTDSGSVLSSSVSSLSTAATSWRPSTNYSYATRSASDAKTWAVNYTGAQSSKIVYAID